MLNHSHEIEFSLKVNENFKSFERIRTGPRFENEANGNS